ncbi:hypothetical protein BU15DRAFT_48080 [Melanogaster broomeanus]|nr:hypothetical protein BU15DRAFT_48080 [Melanogaster broomeanus]
MLPLRITPPVQDHFRRNCLQQLLADDLQVRARRMMECFTGPSLPLPSDEINAAWHLLPNGTIDILPLSLKTGMIILRAPPPTPTDPGFEMDDSSTLSESTSRSHDGSLLVIPSSRQESPTPLRKFQEMVDSGTAEYRARGMDPFVESLVISGVDTIQSASLVSSSAHAIIKKVTRSSYMEGKRLEKAIRVSAMEMFRQHWKPWVEVSSTSMKHSPLTLRGVNKAGFMGSLFDAKVATAEDIALCLSLLLEGDKHFDRLCAMHAVLTQANDKLCKNRNLPALMNFKENLTIKDPESGEYVWATSQHSSAILKDILATIEGWIATQTLKRVRYRASAMNRSIPKHAIGPRLRNNTEQLQV